MRGEIKWMGTVACREVTQGGGARGGISEMAKREGRKE